MEVNGNERDWGMGYTTWRRNVYGELKEVFDWLLLLFLWHA